MTMFKCRAPMAVVDEDDPRVPRHPSRHRIGHGDGRQEPEGAATGPTASRVRLATTGTWPPTRRMCRPSQSAPRGDASEDGGPPKAPGQRPGRGARAGLARGRDPGSAWRQGGIEATGPPARAPRRTTATRPPCARNSSVNTSAVSLSGSLISLSIRRQDPSWTAPRAGTQQLQRGSTRTTPAPAPPGY